MVSRSAKAVGQVEPQPNFLFKSWNQQKSFQTPEDVVHSQRGDFILGLCAQGFGIFIRLLIILMSRHV